MTSLDDLDRALTAANLKRARALRESVDEGTQEAARADEEAWYEAQEVGLRYLEARFEHDAREAGLYVDPSAFVVEGVEEGPIPAPPTEA